MERLTISSTTSWNLCTACGICKGICSKEAISWEKKNGHYLPVIDETACVKCGLCAAVCPGLTHDYGEGWENKESGVKGRVLATYNAWSCDPTLRHVSASGGVVSTLIGTLLRTGNYDAAFVVRGYDYHEQLTTSLASAKDLEDLSGSNIPKSRYLPVSHENAVSFIRANRDKKVIIIGSGCAVRGLQKAIQALHLNRENYLMIGLFCDRVFTYRVMDYFGSEHFCGNSHLENLHFKNKESGGWPGNMKFFLSDGSAQYWDKSERTKAKDLFMPERCLYCVDKLNASADISLGDNYTQQDSSPLGSNSVIIRTSRGLTAWEMVSDQLEFCPVDLELIWKAQYVDWRLNNLCYAELKEKEIKKECKREIVLNKGLSSRCYISDYEWRRERSLEMMHIGELFASEPEKLFHNLHLLEEKDRQGGSGYLARLKRFVLRKLKG